MIDLDQLRQLTFLQDVIWLDEVSSTNSVVLEEFGASDQLPVLLGAEKQNQGRGRKNHRWWACQGSLTFSLLIQPRDYGISPARWPLLSLLTGLAVCQGLEQFLPGRNVQLKWPNDVYVEGRKICGVLLESAPTDPARLVIGIGINCNNSLVDASPELFESATSLIDLRGEAVERTAVLLAVLHQLKTVLQQLGADDPQLIARCRERCYLSGRLLTIQDVARTLSGVCDGIADDGALILHSERGTQKIYSGIITHIGALGSPRFETH